MHSDSNWTMPEEEEIKQSDGRIRRKAIFSTDDNPMKENDEDDEDDDEGISSDDQDENDNEGESSEEYEVSPKKKSKRSKQVKFHQFFNTFFIQIFQ